MIADAHGVAECLRIRRVFLEGTKGDVAQLARHIVLEELGAAVHRVHRLSRTGLSRIPLRKLEIRGSECVAFGR